jgi:hypothetical protein
MKFPVRPRTLEDLERMATPQPVAGGQSEAVPWQLFNVQTYVSAATTQLQFFTAAPAGPRFGNVGGAGLPTPQFFEMYYASLDPKIEPAVAGTPLIDMWSILNGVVGGLAGDPTWTFELADKKLGQFPLRGLHGTGGPTGFTTNVTTEYANNADAAGLGSFCFDGAIVIPPTQAFSVTLDWPAPVTLAAGDIELVITLTGVLHRRVL